MVDRDPETFDPRQDREAGDAARRDERPHGRQAELGQTTHGENRFYTLADAETGRDLLIRRELDRPAADRAERHAAVPGDKRFGSVPRESGAVDGSRRVRPDVGGERNESARRLAGKRAVRMPAQGAAALGHQVLDAPACEVDLRGRAGDRKAVAPHTERALEVVGRGLRVRERRTHLPAPGLPRSRPPLRKAKAGADVLAARVERIVRVAVDAKPVRGAHVEPHHQAVVGPAMTGPRRADTLAHHLAAEGASDVR